jgi:two-component system, NarL family, response regulator LiaR
LIVDDHHLVREGLAALLEIKPDLEVVGFAADGNEAVEKAIALQPDVILLDLVMPNKDGITAIREIRALNPDAKVLVLTSFTQQGKVRAAMEAGARGYQLKDSSPPELLRAIYDVYRGLMPLHPAIARKAMPNYGNSPPQATQPELTDRELAVLELVALGLTNREIGEQLNIAERTVTTHVSRILGKLGLENRTQAAFYAYREGLIGDEQDI